MLTDIETFYTPHTTWLRFCYAFATQAAHPTTFLLYLTKYRFQYSSIILTKHN